MMQRPEIYHTNLSPKHKTSQIRSLESIAGVNPKRSLKWVHLISWLASLIGYLERLGSVECLVPADHLYSYAAAHEANLEPSSQDETIQASNMVDPGQAISFKQANLLSTVSNISLSSSTATNNPFDSSQPKQNVTNGSSSNASSAPILDLSIYEATRLNFFRHSMEISVIICIAYTIVFVVGIVGNSFVVAIVCKSPRMRTVTNYFIANLALADILVLVLCLPATLVSNLYIPYVLGLFVCKTVSYLQGVSVSASINTMVAVTIDRFLAICFPMDWHMSRRVARWTIAGIWLFSLGISLPWAIYFDLFEYDYGDVKFYVCNDIWPDEQLGRIYFVCANLILLYVLPGALIMLCYLGIWYKIERRNIPGDRPKGLKIELIMQKSKLKVVKMMMVVVVIFLLSWLPLYLIFARLKLGENLSQREEWIIGKLMPLAQWLGASNSCINPILYTFFNRKYKRGFIELLTFGLCCRSSSRGSSSNGARGRESRHSDGAVTFNNNLGTRGESYLTRQRTISGCTITGSSRAKTGSSSLVANGARANQSLDNTSHKSVSNSRLSVSTELSRSSRPERDTSFSSTLVEPRSRRGSSINNQLLPCRDWKPKQKSKQSQQPAITINSKRRFFDHVAGRDSLLIREFRYFRRGLRFDEAKRRQERLLSETNSNTITNTNCSSSSNSNSNSNNGQQKSADLEQPNRNELRIDAVKNKNNRDNTTAGGMRQLKQMNRNRSIQSNSTTDSTDTTVISSTINSGNGNGSRSSQTSAVDDKPLLIRQQNCEARCQIQQQQNSILPNRRRDASDEASSILYEESLNCSDRVRDSRIEQLQVREDDEHKEQNPNGNERLTRVGDIETTIVEDEDDDDNDEEDQGDEEDEDDDNLLFGSIHSTPERKTNAFDLNELTTLTEKSSRGRDSVVESTKATGSSMVQVKICGSIPLCATSVGNCEAHWMLASDEKPDDASQDSINGASVDVQTSSDQTAEHRYPRSGSIRAHASSGATSERVDRSSEAKEDIESSFNERDGCDLNVGMSLKGSP